MHHTPSVILGTWAIPNNEIFERPISRVEHARYCLLTLLLGRASRSVNRAVYNSFNHVFNDQIPSPLESISRAWDLPMHSRQRKRNLPSQKCDCQSLKILSFTISFVQIFSKIDPLGLNNWMNQWKRHLDYRRISGMKFKIHDRVLLILMSYYNIECDSDVDESWAVAGHSISETSQRKSNSPIYFPALRFLELRQAISPSKTTGRLNRFNIQYPIASVLWFMNGLQESEIVETRSENQIFTAFEANLDDSDQFIPRIPPTTLNIKF
jgi:hypothetical protein